MEYIIKLEGSFSNLFTGISQCFLMMMKISDHAKMSVCISAVTVVEAIALIWCLVWSSKKREVHLDRKSLFFFSTANEKDAWRIIPGILASSLSWGLSMTAHSFILGHLGTDVTAAYSVTFGCGLINVGLVGIVGPFVYIFYVLEPQAKVYLVQMLIFSAFYMFAYAYNTIITCGVFPAGGDSRYDAVSVFFATWCFAIPLSLLGCFVFQWSVMIVYFVMCLDEIVKIPFIPNRYKKYLWLNNLTRE